MDSMQTDRASGAERCCAVCSAVSGRVSSSVVSGRRRSDPGIRPQTLACWHGVACSVAAWRCSIAASRSEAPANRDVRRATSLKARARTERTCCLILLCLCVLLKHESSVILYFVAVASNNGLLLCLSGQPASPARKQQKGCQCGKQSMTSDLSGCRRGQLFSLGERGCSYSVVVVLLY